MRALRLSHDRCDAGLTYGPRHRRPPARGWPAIVTLVLALVGLPTHAAEDVQYLRDLLAATPPGGWVRANTNRFSDAWTTGPDALPDGSFSDPSAVVRAWSSFAWDSNRGNLLLFGGGH